MELTVLGRSGPFPEPGGACSGYLVTDRQTRIVCDLGSGTLSRLLTKLSLPQLDAVLLSHLHFDHFSDMLVLQYAMELRMKQNPRQAPLLVYAPATPQLHRTLLKPEFFDVRPIQHDTATMVGSIQIRFFGVSHPVETYAMELTGADGKRLFYTGDTGWMDELPQYARGADALLADTAFPAAMEKGQPLPHMTTAQVCKLARQAGVKQLFCTHLPGTGQCEADVQKEIDFPCATVVQELGQYTI